MYNHNQIVTTTLNIDIIYETFVYDPHNNN